MTEFFQALSRLYRTHSYPVDEPGNDSKTLPFEHAHSD